MWRNPECVFSKVRLGGLVGFLTLTLVLVMLFSGISDYSCMWAYGATNEEGSPEDIFKVIGEDEVLHTETPFNMVTGETLDEEEEETYLSGLPEGVSYDGIRKTFVYDLENGEGPELTVNVVDGMLTNTPVFVSMEDGISCHLYQDGSLLKDPDLNNICETGAYTLVVDSLNEANALKISFRIVGETANVACYTLPEGFRLRKVFFNGVERTVKGDTVSMEEEGRYDITYVCNESGILYEFQANIDHTAPELALKAVNHKGLARYAVSLADLEEGAGLLIRLDGKIIPATRKLTQPGLYHLTVYDRAGNSRDYDFQIRRYYTASTLICAGALILVLAGAFVYIRQAKKKLRVR